MTDIELMGYMILFALSVMWSTFGINRKSAIFCLLSWATWHTLTAYQFYLSATGATLAIMYVFFGLGWMFLVLGLVFIIENFKRINAQKEMELR